MSYPGFNRLRMRNVRALLALVAAALALPCRGAEPAERGFAVIDSYSAVEVGMDIAGFCGTQDPQGIMYFGSDSLLAFDGDRWRSVKAAGSDTIYGLTFGPDGKLWVAAAGELGWFTRDGGTWHYQSLNAHLPAGGVGDIFYAVPHGAGAVFAGEDKVLYWDGRTMRTWSMPGDRRVRAFRDSGEVYVLHQSTGLYVMRNGEPKLAIPAEVLGGRGILWLEKRGDEFLLLTQFGFVRVAGGKLEETASAAGEYLREHSPTSAVPLPDGRFAVGTMDNGIVFISRNGGIDGVLNTANGLNFTYAMPLCVDRDGALWAGSRASIVRIPLAARTTIFDSRANMSVQPIARITRHAGQLVLASPEGMYGLRPETRQFELRVRGFWNDMYSDGRGLFLAGYRSLTRLEGGHASVIHSTNADLGVVAAIRGTPGIHVGDGKRVLALTPDGSSRVLVENLPEPANSIAEDAGGKVWLGTNAHGLFVSGHGAVAERVPNALGLSNPPGPAVAAALADGTVLAFTRDGAWVRPAGRDHFTAVTRAPARAVAATTPDAGGTGTWVVYRATPENPAALAHVAVDTGQAAWQPHAIRAMTKIGVPTAMFAEGSVLWIGGTQGVLRHELSDTLGVPVPHAPLVHALAHTGGPRPQPIGRQALPASTRSVEFEFALPEFGRRSTLRLETRIDGIEPDWVAVAPGAPRELNQIRPGHYTVRARAVTEAGDAGPETILTFEVLKPWWQTTPALVAAAILSLLAATGAYQLRVRTLRRRNAELEEKVRVRTEELERASAAKTEFVANMSHDIRNPLNGIVGLSLALEDTRLDSRQREIVATLRECTTYLSTLVDDVLDFASIEAGRVELRSGPYNAAELLRSIVTTLRTDSIQSGATLTVEIDPALPPHLLGDAGRVQQILVNYVSNALKYAGGAVRLAARLPAGAPGEIEFSVTDQGPGLSAADQETLFTKFTRTAQARQHAIPGTGLGLAACRLLADIMGGSVGVISRPGAGACFFLRLPLVAAQERPIEPARALPNATVLLVEDTDYNAAAATAVLGRLGLGCERARTGEEALRLFSQKRYNIVLLDRNLPDMDGTVVARRMRELEDDGLRSVLLAVTAYCTAEDRACCIEAGMDAFVGKPLTPEKLRKVLLAAAQPLRGTATLQMRPERSVPAGVPGLDTTLLQYLAGDGEGALERQIQRFTNNLGETEAALAQALAVGDADALAATAHRILGDARMIGATDLGEAALALERAARSASLPDCPALLETVTGEVARVTEALHHPRAGQSA